MGDHALSRPAIGELALVQDDLPAPRRIKRAVGEVAGDRLDHLGSRGGDANRMTIGDVHVVREPVVARRRSHEGLTFGSVEADVHHRRVEDARLDGDGRSNVDDDVGVAQGVAQVALVLGHHVDGEAIGPGYGGAERLLDDYVWHALELAIGADLVARVQPHQHLRAGQRTALDRRA